MSQETKTLIKMLKSILKASITPSHKFFKVWTEPDPGDDKKTVSCIFATDGQRALLIKNHGLFLLPGPGVYALCGDDPVLCSDCEEVRQAAERSHDRVMLQKDTITLVEYVKVPQIKSSARKRVPVSIPGDIGEPWQIGFRSGRPSVSADLLPPIEEWDSISFTKENFPVKFDLIDSGERVISYLVMPMTLGS